MPELQPYQEDESRNEYTQSRTRVESKETIQTPRKEYFFILKFDNIKHVLFAPYLVDQDFPEEAFWTDILSKKKIKDNGFTYTKNEAEKLIQNFFPNRLKDLMVEKTRFSLKSVGFRVSKISYKSLDLVVELTGITTLTKVFNANLDLFISFLEFYAPVALLESLGNSLEEKAAPDDLQTSVTVSADLESDFSFIPAVYAPPKKPAGKASDDNKLQKFWMLSNYSLVIPVVLSLLVLYVAFKNFVETKQSYLQNYNSLLQQQNHLLHVQDSLIKNQFAIINNLRDTSFKAKR